MASDAELVLAARAGDPANLGVLLDRHRAPLYGMALRLLGHGQQAEDAVHDTFLVALRKGWIRSANPPPSRKSPSTILNPHQSNAQPHVIPNDL